MTSDFRVTGAEDLERLAKRLKGAGDKDLKKDLLAGIRKTNKPTIADIRASARDTLPRGGGLAALVASSKIGTRTRLSGSRVGIEITGAGKGVRALRSLNAGRLTKPLFGNREHWYGQAVEPGFFDKPIEKDLPRIRLGIEEAMRGTAQRIERGI